MAGNATKSVLRTYLINNTVDEALLHYVSMNAHTVLYISQEHLCEQAHVTEAQAQAFFQAFGVDSFLAFKFILRKCLYHEVTDQGVVKRQLTSLADEVIRLEMHNLATFAAEIDHEKIDRLAEDILAASEVTVFVRTASTPIAVSLKNMLRLLKIPVKLYYENTVYDQDDLEAISASGLVIIFSRMRYSLKMLMDIRRLKQLGLHIVCFTDYSSSPFIPLSDYHFVLPTSSFDFADSTTVGTTFVHILSLCLAMKREEDFYFRMQERDIKTRENNMFL